MTKDFVRQCITRDNRRMSFIVLMLWTQAMLGVFIACIVGAWDDFVHRYIIIDHDVINGKSVHVSGFIGVSHEYWICRLGNCFFPYASLCLWIAHAESVIRFGGVLRRVKLIYLWRFWK